jgi:hypothetical protein
VPCFWGTFQRGKAEWKTSIQPSVGLGIQKQNLVLALCIALAAVFLFLWGCPFLADYGHRKLCIALYVLLLLIYVYGRASGARQRHNAAKRNV